MKGGRMNLRMKELRLKAGFKTQEELAERIGETKRRVGAWERKETQITLADAVRLCDALECSPNDLCGWYEDHPKEQGLTCDESSMLADYRACTPEWRRNIRMTAIAAHRESFRESERPSSDAVDADGA